jgi:hypothetical protein
MSAAPNSAVVEAFLVDHKKFMRLLRDVSVALEEGDTELARQLARELDHVAGPHIAFEERVLYPALDVAIADRSFVRTLFQEHEQIVQALARLLDTQQLDARAVDELKSAFRAGLAHAEHCGTLISRLSALDEAEQREALDKLTRLRTSGLTWTKLKKEA